MISIFKLSSKILFSSGKHRINMDDVSVKTLALVHSSKKLIKLESISYICIYKTNIKLNS